ncbi:MULTISPECIES: helix-turn-helix domain-containing protein [Pantoea]|uniref:helix-turn-helix domain-containing protein n=1 Tax=Pantoea TaxID=53335 RepID=UPI001F1B403B|nr:MULTISPECIES: helix-turn-helix transcriptional regulator [Pantoea]UIL54621.1 helix-turn-helix transcriptional regulator [Pantoea agglomerans]
MSVIQFLTDDRGNRTSAVIPIELFNKLMAESHLSEEAFEPVPYQAGPDDDETIPHEVLKISRRQSVPLHVAWRLHRKMSQEDVATALGITQAGVSKLESRKKPQKQTLEKLATLYQCRTTQLYID